MNLTNLEFFPKSEKDRNEKCVCMFNFACNDIIMRFWSVEKTNAGNYAIRAPYCKINGERIFYNGFEKKEDFLLLSAIVIEAAKEQGYV